MICSSLDCMVRLVIVRLFSNGRWSFLFPDSATTIVEQDIRDTCCDQIASALQAEIARSLTSRLPRTFVWNRANSSVATILGERLLAGSLHSDELQKSHAVINVAAMISYFYVDAVENGRQKGDQGWPCPPGIWNLTFSSWFFSKKGCFNFEWVKRNFKIFAPPLEKSTVVPPWKISFRRPWLLTSKFQLDCDVPLLYISQCLFTGPKHVTALSLHTDSCCESLSCTRSVRQSVIAILYIFFFISFAQDQPRSLPSTPTVLNHPAHDNQSTRFRNRSGSPSSSVEVSPLAGSQFAKHAGEGRPRWESHTSWPLRS